MTTAPATLTKLAQRFDTIRDATQGRMRSRAARNAAQLRFVASLVINGVYTAEQGWIWADAAAGQLLNDTRQLEKKAGRR